MGWVAGVCEGCGLGYELDPTEGPVDCTVCECPVCPLAVDDAHDAGDDVVDLEAAELADLERREAVLALALGAFDAAGLGGLAAAVERLDGDTARACLFVAVVQLAEADALAELAEWN